MQSDSNLRETLRSIDHKSYPAYKSLRGSYRFADYVLSIDHVQGDPFAAPSHVRVTGRAQHWQMNCCARLPHRSTTLHLRRRDRARAA